MAFANVHLVLAVLSASASVVLGNPIAQAGPPPSGTCKGVQPCVSRLQAWTDSPSYCSSLLSITPTTVYSTVPGTTTTTTLPVDTITAPPNTVYTTVTSTTTVCTENTPAGNAKRAEGTPSPVPSQLQKCKRTNIPKACSCLSLSTDTVTSTTTSDTTVTATPDPASTTVTPPAVTSTTTTTTTVTVGPGSGTPTVVLTSPTAITGVDANGLATSSYDDDFFTVQLPFAVKLYGASATAVDVSVNGWIALVQGQSSSSYINAALPVNSTGGSSGIPDVVFAAYWNDLYIYQGTPQGLYYQVYGTAPQRKVSFEWYTSLFQNSNGYYHFITTLEEANPGAATYTYYQANGQRPGNTNLLGTVGVQRASQNKFKQYSYNTLVPAGTEIRYNPTTNKFVDQSQTTCPVANPQSFFRAPTPIADIPAKAGES